MSGAAIKPTEVEERHGALAKLREPFSSGQISKLPKETRAQADERKQNRGSGIKCEVCGGWHHKNAVHLDYVGHAALTNRLLDADPLWSWEPISFDAGGLPALDRNGGMWIKLTVAGVTRLGYGSADGKTGGDAVKELIGDALRNAAMRFGAALDLWHKGDLHADEETDDREEAAPARQQRQQHQDKPADDRRQASPDRAMIEWVDKAKVKLASFEDGDAFNAFADYTNADEFIRRKEAITKANPSLGAELKQAIDDAEKRVDDVPF